MATTYEIKLVNHTKATERLKTAIMAHLQKLFDETFKPVPDSAKVEWGTGIASDSIVVHVVDDIASSYLQQKWPGKEISGDDGGHTRSRGSITGSEIYLHAVIGGKRTLMKDEANAHLAFHEALHNQWPGWTNTELHAKGSLAASPPKVPLSDEVAEFMRKGLSMKNEQLL